MDFQKARPEYYEGLKIFQNHTNQQEQLKKLLVRFFYHLRSEIENVINRPETPDDLKTHYNEFINTPLFWHDIGSGDGTFTRKIFESLNENSFKEPVYQGIDPDPYFCETSRRYLSDFANAHIIQDSALEGNLHKFGSSDVISGMNVLYFANDFSLLKEDFRKTLKPSGLGLFIQNTLFTEKAGQALMGDQFIKYTADIDTEVFFPPVPKHGFELITGKAGVAEIEQDAVLTDDEKKNTILTKKIIDSMGGISTETDKGQQVAKRYEERIQGNDFGGNGKYISDNCLLIYLHPEANESWHHIILTTLESVRRDITLDKKQKLQNTACPHLQKLEL